MASIIYYQWVRLPLVRLKELKITVNKNGAQEMVNELGALIIDIRTQEEPKQSNQNTDQNIATI